MRVWELRAILRRLLRRTRRPGIRLAPASTSLALAQRSPAAGACVLLASSDRRFRAVTSALLSQRGYTVLVSGPGHDIVELALSKGAGVVLIDASGSLTDAARTAAKLGARAPSIGIVAVSADPQTALAALPLLPKWAPFHTLITAIDRALADPIRKRALGVR